MVAEEVLVVASARRAPASDTSASLAYMTDATIRSWGQGRRSASDGVPQGHEAKRSALDAGEGPWHAASHIDC